MSYEVVVEELRASARRFRTVQDATEGYAFPAQCVTADAMGHVELADWVIAVLEQCDKAGTALNSGTRALADGLEEQAADYESTDLAVRSCFGGRG